MGLFVVSMLELAQSDATARAARFVFESAQDALREAEEEYKNQQVAVAEAQAIERIGLGVLASSDIFRQRAVPSK